MTEYERNLAANANEVLERLEAPAVPRTDSSRSARLGYGYRSVAVHVKAYEDTSEHIEVAVRLALDFQARLTGVLTLRETSIIKALYTPRTWPVERMQRLEELALQAENRFRAITAQPGLHAEFHRAEGDAAELLSFLGRLHDLLVVEQTDLTHDEIGFDVPEHCVAATGRPVLVVPFRGEFPTVGRRVLIAWNGSREATLAVQHALPFIRNAEQVTLLEGAGKERFSSVTKWPPITMRSYLRTQTDRLKIATLPEVRGDIGEAILEAAENAKADLVVMGACGRSWVSEWVLGGATRHCLRHMRVPLLMAT